MQLRDFLCEENIRLHDMPKKTVVCKRTVLNSNLRVVGYIILSMISNSLCIMCHFIKIVSHADAKNSAMRSVLLVLVKFLELSLKTLMSV